MSALYESSDAVGVGGDGNDNSSYHSGAVYVFTSSGTMWTQQVYIKAFNLDGGDRFGGFLDLEGSTLVVSASREDAVIGLGSSDNSAMDSGAVYVLQGM